MSINKQAVAETTEAAKNVIRTQMVNLEPEEKEAVADALIDYLEDIKYDAADFYENDDNDD